MKHPKTPETGETLKHLKRHGYKLVRWYTSGTLVHFWYAGTAGTASEALDRDGLGDLQVKALDGVDARRVI